MYQKAPLCWHHKTLLRVRTFNCQDAQKTDMQSCLFLNMGTGIVIGFKLMFYWDICFDLPNCYKWNLPSHMQCFFNWDEQGNTRQSLLCCTRVVPRDKEFICESPACRIYRYTVQFTWDFTNQVASRSHLSCWIKGLHNLSLDCV